MTFAEIPLSWKIAGLFCGFIILTCAVGATIGLVQYHHLI